MERLTYEPWDDEGKSLKAPRCPHLENTKLGGRFCTFDCPYHFYTQMQYPSPHTKIVIENPTKTVFCTWDESGRIWKNRATGEHVIFIKEAERRYTEVPIYKHVLLVAPVGNTLAVKVWDKEHFLLCHEQLEWAIDELGMGRKIQK